MNDRQQIDRIASLYYTDVGRFDLPSKEEEVRLFTEYRKLIDQERTMRELDRPKDAAHFKREKDRLGQHLACGYVRFVISQARRRTRDPQLLQELIGEGNVGLMIGVERFDPARGNRFLTYAAWWINVQMQEHLKKVDHVHIPNHTRKEIRKRKKEEEVLFARGEITQSSVIEPSVAPIDPNIHAADAHTDRDTMDRERNMLQHLIDAGIPLRDRMVVIYYYGLRDTQNKTFNEISQLFWELDGSAITGDRVRQIKEHALSTLRQYMRDRGIGTTVDLL